MFEADIMRLQAMIDRHHAIVFFGGAGVSTESGIPDFRSAEGLYRNGHILSPETLVSHDILETDPALFYSFYREHLVHPEAIPNPAHKVLAALEQAGKLKGIITQNIDGLHQMAGSRAVLELHGSIHRNTCLSCGRIYPLATILQAAGIPRCEHCGGTVRPDVVLYGEMLDPHVMRQALTWMEQADMLIVGGTSLVVYPAAGLLSHFRGDTLVILNRDPTPWDNRADLLLRMPIGEALKGMRIS